LVATSPDDPRRVSAKIVNSISWGLRRSRGMHGFIAKNAAKSEPLCEMSARLLRARYSA
jgi:hypothetical protein